MLKRFLYSSMSLILALFFLSSVILAFSYKPQEAVSREKVYCEASLEDDFTDDAVMIVLTNEASLEFVDYTLEDFREIGCVEIQDLSSAKGNKIKAQLNGEPPAGTGMMYGPFDVTKFRRILYLKLGAPGKANVLAAIRILQCRDDIYAAEPNYILQLID